MNTKTDDYPVLRVRVSQEQRDKVYRLGGASWIKEQIDSAVEVDPITDAKLIAAAPKLLKILDQTEAMIYRLLSGMNSSSEVKKLKQIRGLLEGDTSKATVVK